jgi:1-phosphatidylinositol phosphodiesterase
MPLQPRSNSPRVASHLLALLAVLFPLRFATAANSDWMRWIPDSANLTALSLPGTHDTMARESVSSNPWVVTQSLELRPQLDAGIRVLDIRARHYDNRFTIHHGAVYLDTNFDDVLSTVKQFLIDHPSETILMRVKQEHYPEFTTRSFEETFEWYRDQPVYSPFIWRGTTVPALGQARGKIVIIDDFSPEGTYGIRWGGLSIQDAWDVTDIDDKWNLVRDHLIAAKTGNPNTLYVNFLTAWASRSGRGTA